MAGMDLTRCRELPDSIQVDAGSGWQPATGSGSERGVAGVTVRFGGSERLAITVEAVAGVRAVRLRWRQRIAGCRMLGDAWERGYGDLEWRGLVPERQMPWYVLIHDGQALHGLGVETGGAAMAAWLADSDGITLELDLRCGGLPVRPGRRSIAAATVVVRPGRRGEDEHAAAHAFCRLLCPAPRLPSAPVFGLNDWYYAYGTQDGAGVRRDARRAAGWCEGLPVQPWVVIDGGWQEGAGGDGVGVGGRFAGNARFGDMARLAADVSAAGSRPGLWLRPLQSMRTDDDRLLLSAKREGRTLDPSRAEVLAEVQDRVHTAVGWGYGLLKHDFSTFDVFGRWGFQMGTGVTADGWGFADPTRTSAEILRGLYVAIRAAAGDALVLGCNTVGHLAAGLEELQRTGDDTSGRSWERTRRMGPNTLAMRMPQHGAFFCADADCIGLTPAIPWELNRAWLDAVAGSGTALFVSPHPEAVGPEQDAALRAAFALAAAAPPSSAALDWRETTTPTAWKTPSGVQNWTWGDGAEPHCPP
jgi:alpha-galactosidase